MGKADAVSVSLQWTSWTTLLRTVSLWRVGRSRAFTRGTGMVTLTPYSISVLNHFFFPHPFKMALATGWPLILGHAIAN